MIKNVGFSFLAVVFGLVSALAFAGESSSVGSGGSTVREFVKTARGKVAKTVEAVLKEAAENGEDAVYRKLCRYKDGDQDTEWSDEHIKFCIEYAKSVLPTMMNITTVEPIVDFVLTDKPLRDLEGEPAEAICTSTDLSVPIVFNEGVSRQAPRQILFLWFHELGHKIPYDGIQGEDKCIYDKKPVGPFVKGGRDLLNTLAYGLSNYALRKNIIGDEFHLLDFFMCKTIQEGVERPIFVIEGASQRSYTLHNDFTFEKYIAGFNSESAFFNGLVPDPYDHSRDLVVEIIVSEPEGCGKDAGQDRFTRMILSGVKSNREKEPIAQTVLERINILCEEDKPILTIKYEALTFTCEHTGTLGTALKPVPSEIQSYFKKEPNL